MFLFLFQYGTQLAGSLIKDQVTQHSNSGYVVDFSKLEINLLNKEILITELEVFRTNDSINTDRQTIYEIFTPKLRIKVGSLVDLYIRKDLKISGIKIYDPEVLIMKTDGSGEKTSLSFETGAIYKGISAYLNSFSIQKFEIDNAAVQYSKSDEEGKMKVQVDEIDFLIKNFKLDSTASDSSKFLFTDQIELIITNQTFDLADSIHQISFEEFHISTSTGDILFNGLKMKPKESISIEHLSSYINISIPEFNFRGLDFSVAYKDNQLLLDSVRILKPDIKIFKQQVGSRRSDKKDLNLLALATTLFPDIKVNRLYLDQANLSLELPNKSHMTTYRGNQINLRFDQVHLDASHTSIKDLPNAYAYMHIDGANLFTYLLDSTHTIEIGKINYSSKSSDAYLSQVRIKPISSAKTQIDFELDEIRLTRMTTFDDLIQGNIITDQLDIIRPRADIILGETLQDSAGGKKQFLKQFKVNKLKYVDGVVRIEDGENEYLINHATANIEALNFSPLDSQQVLFSRLTSSSHIRLKDLMVRSEKLKLDLHQLDLIDWKTLHADNIEMQSARMDEPFTFKKVSVTAFDLDHFIYNEQLLFDTLIIDEPVINLHPHEDSETNRKKLIKWAHHTDFKEVKVTNGLLTQYDTAGKVMAHLHEFDAELSSFHYDSISNEYSTHIGYRSDSLYLLLPQIHHELTGKEISISITDSTLDIKEMRLLPLSDTVKNRFDVASHEFKLRQIDFHRLINENQLHFYTGYLLSPKVNIQVYRETKEPKPMKKDLVKFGSLNVSNGTIHFENHLKDSSMMVDINKFDLLIANFDLGKDSTIFSAKNYLIDARKISMRHYGKTDTINIQSAFINTKVGDIKIKDLRLRPSENTSVLMPGIHITGLDPEILAHEKRFVMDSLLIMGPQINLNLKEQKPRTTAAAIRLPSLQSQYMGIQGGHLTLQKPDLNHAQPINIEKIELSLNQFSIDSTSSVTDIPDFLPNTTFSMGSVSLHTPDSLYQFTIASVDYDGKSDQLVFHNLLLDPLYSRSQFQEQIDFQKDWLDLHIDEIRLSHLDAERLINENYAEIDRIDIINLNLDTHRDKRLPFDPKAHKPLPQALIMSSPVMFYIGSINIKNGFVSHSEFSETGSLPGNIFFKRINGQIQNISNDRDRLALSPIMTFESTGVMMNTGNFDITVDFDLLDDTQFFYFQGELNDMDLTELNRLLEHTAFVHIRDGYNKHVTFDFEANQDYAIGDMKFYYEDLKIRVLNPDNQSNSGHGASIKSFFANTFVVSKQNPHFLFVREGNIFHHRDGTKAIFNYWAKALLSGVVSSIGAKNNKKEIKKLNDELQAELDRKRGETLIRANRERLPK